MSSGAHRKVSSEYVGAGVRAETRRRILAELAERIDRLTAELDAATSAVEALTRRRDDLRALRRALPRGTSLDRAWTALDHADVAVESARRELGEARARARDAVAEAAALRRRVDATARAADLPTDPDRLDEAITGFREFGGEIDQLRQGLAEIPSLTENHPALVTTFEDRLADAQAAAETALVARERHAEAARELAQQEAAIGATEQQLMDAEADATRRHTEARTAIPTAERAAAEARDALVRAQERRDQALADRAGQEQVVIASGQALRTALLLGGLTDAAGLEIPHALTEDDLAPDDVRARLRRLEELAREVAGGLAAARLDVSDSLILRRAQELGAALPGGLDAAVGERDGIKMVEVLDDTGSHAVAIFASRIATELAEARTRLSDREQDVFRRFLLGELGDSLTRQLTAARQLVADMNDVLAEVRSSHGIGVRLVWEVRGDADADTRAAVELLAIPSGLRTPAAADRLREALQRLIEAERSDDPSAGYAAHLRKALDYRDWHTFDVRVTDAFGRERRLGPRTGLSQGEQRVVSYLVLFAAAAAHFTSLAQNEPRVPRMILLDDAFAKVDEPTHAKLLELLVDLDLDFVLTSERLWGNAPAVPSLHVYECLRDPLVRGVATLHYEWNGRRMRLVSP